MQKLEILKLGLVSFGKFRNQEIELQPGLNLIEGGNEAGKSTLQSFLTGMFYGFYQPGAKRRCYTLHQEKYQPWDGGSYRGFLICRTDKRILRIERSFDREDESVKVYDDVTGDDLTIEFPYNSVTRQVQVGETLLGLSKTAFNNTANIAQMNCDTISREAGFSAEVNDKLLSMMKTADSSLSMSAVIQELDNRSEQIGTPKKSKTPYGQATLKEKELLDELAESQNNEAEYLELCQKGRELAAEISRLEKDKNLLEAQIRESAAKELGGRYLKAQNLKTRIERLEKENEKYLLYQDVDLDVIDQAQKRLGAKAQIARTLEKYRRALEELDRRIQELNNLYRTLEVSGADDSILEQFDLMFERHLNLESLRDELRELQIKKSNISFHRSKLTAMDGEALEEDIQKLHQIEQLKSQKKPDPSGKIGLALLIFGILLLLAGVISAILAQQTVALFGAAAAGIGIIASLIGTILMVRHKKAGTRGNTLEHLCQVEEEILTRYQLEQAIQPIAHLEEMLGRVQINNYKIHQFEEQENLLLEEISTKSQRANQMEAEIGAYLQKLTGLGTEGLELQLSGESEKQLLSTDEIRLKSLKESVNQAKRIRTDLQRLHLQQQQIQQEEENCKNQIEQINSAIQMSVQSCASAGAQDSDDLEKCRQGKRRLDELSVELKLQKELLAETLGNYSYEELEETVRTQRTVGETEISSDRKDIHNKLTEVQEQLSSLTKTAAELDGLRQGKEESQRPVGQVQSDLDEVRTQCQKYQLELDALHLAKEKLLSLSGQLHRDFAPQLNLKVSQAIEQISNGRYKKAVIDQNLGIRLEDQKSGRLVEISSLSNGTVDLIYLIMRLELLNLLSVESGKKVRVPIILDDSFTQLDDERTARLLRYLLEIPDVQILLFSCHQREREILTRAQIAHHWIYLER